MTPLRVHDDIELVLAAVDAAGVPRTASRAEADNAGYAGTVCEVGGATTRFRVARVTPRKTGLFVAVWRRAADGSTEPFDVGDQRHLVIVVREGEEVGAFVFPAEVLTQRGVVAVGGAGGKRGFRVYPAWSTTQSGQAAATQHWQCAHFLPLAAAAPGATDRVRRLFA